MILTNNEPNQEVTEENDHDSRTVLYDHDDDDDKTITATHNNSQCHYHPIFHNTESCTDR